MPVTRRHLQIVLGILWIADGALQLQPFMFTTGFAARVIAPNAQGQPAFVADAVRWSSGLILSHHVLADAGFAAVQLLIGVALLLRPLSRAALAGSICWGLGVWYFGEGLGGLASGHTSLLAGAPGAALVLVVLSAAAWPEAVAGAPPGLRLRRLAGGEGSDVAPRPWIVVAWAVVWIGGALLRALPAEASTGSLRQTVTAATQGSPGWLAPAQHAMAGWIGASGGALVPAIVVLQVAVGAMALMRGQPRALAAVMGIAAALAQWVFGQGMGQITSGQATDPNAGLLLVVMAVVVLATNAAPRRSGALAARAPSVGRHSVSADLAA